MSYYSNEFENTKDYLEGKTPLIKELCEVRGVPEGADLQTHLRMMYGHVAWNNLIIELTPEIISLLKTKIDSVETGFNVLQTLQPYKHVALLNTETLGPITYNEIVTDSVKLELLDADTAMELAAHWFVEDLLETNFDFAIFSQYFIVAYRLALFENRRADEEQFSEERLNRVWREVFSKTMILASQKLLQESVSIPEKAYWINFKPSDYELEDYLNAI